MVKVYITRLLKTTKRKIEALQCGGEAYLNPAYTGLRVLGDSSHPAVLTGSFISLFSRGPYLLWPACVCTAHTDWPQEWNCHHIPAVPNTHPHMPAHLSPIDLRGYMSQLLRVLMVSPSPVLSPYSGLPEFQPFSISVIILLLFLFITNTLSDTLLWAIQAALDD